MLYSLLVCVVIQAVLCPLIAIFSFVKGYNLKAEKLAEKPLKVIPRPHKAPKGDPKLVALLENINNYDGTGKGQKEING